MKYRVVAADEVYARMLKLELDRLGLTEAREGSADFSLCVAEGQTELPRSRGCRGARRTRSCFIRTSSRSGTATIYRS